VTKSDDKGAAKSADIAPSDTAIQSTAVSLKLLLTAALLLLEIKPWELFTLCCMVPTSHADTACG
jgi:hypothetical protein